MRRPGARWASRRVLVGAEWPGRWKHERRRISPRTEGDPSWDGGKGKNRQGKTGNSDRLNFLGIQNHCRWWLQSQTWKTLAPWKKSYDKPRWHIKNQRHYFADKGPSSQSCGFSSVTYGCESWTIKKAKSQRIDAFELWCWRRLLRIPWTARRLNQSILKEIGPEYSLEGQMLKPKLWPILWPPDAPQWKRPWC